MKKTIIIILVLATACNSSQQKKYIQRSQSIIDSVFIVGLKLQSCAKTIAYNYPAAHDAFITDAAGMKVFDAAYITYLQRKNDNEQASKIAEFNYYKYLQAAHQAELEELLNKISDKKERLRLKEQNEASLLVLDSEKYDKSSH